MRVGPQYQAVVPDFDAGKTPNDSGASRRKGSLEQHQL